MVRTTVSVNVACSTARITELTVCHGGEPGAKERDRGVYVDNPCPPKNQGDGEGLYLAHLHVRKHT